MFDFSKREKKMVAGGLVFLVLFFGYQTLFAPIFENHANLTRILGNKQAAFNRMVVLSRQYQQRVGQAGPASRDLAGREKDFSLFSYLDSQVRLSGIKQNVEYMKPFTKKLEKSDYQLATVKVKLRAVYLGELIDFLFRIESSGNGVTITSLSLSKTGKEKNRLDAVIETRTYIAKKEGRT
jgi:hypothetical protein